MHPRKTTIRRLCAACGLRQADNGHTCPLRPGHGHQWVWTARLPRNSHTTAPRRRYTHHDWHTLIAILRDTLHRHN